MRPLLILILLTASACTRFPELDAGESAAVRNAAYPDLLPLDQLLDAPAPTVSPQMAAGIEGRVSALRARAARLTRPVVDGGTRARMARGVASPF